MTINHAAPVVPETDAGQAALSSSSCPTVAVGPVVNAQPPSSWHTSLPALTLPLSGFDFLTSACFVSFPRGDLDDPRFSDTLTFPGESADTGFLLFKKLLVLAEEPV